MTLGQGYRPPRVVANQNDGLMLAEDKARLDGMTASFTTADETTLDRLAAPPAFRAYSIANLSVASGGAGTTGVFGTEQYDTHAAFSASTTYTVPTGWGGVWHLGSTCLFAANATGRRLLNLFKGGSLYDYDERENRGAAIVTPLRVEGDYLLAAGDVLTINYGQDSGGALNVNASGIITAFWGHWVRP